jgi:hypothetical protein
VAGSWQQPQLQQQNLSQHPGLAWNQTIVQNQDQWLPSQEPSLW